MPYDCIEVMACPGGCIGGGGQAWSVSDLAGGFAPKQFANLRLDIFITDLDIA